MVRAYGVGGLLGIGVFFLVASGMRRSTLYRLQWAAYAAASFTLVALPELPMLVPALVLIGITVGAIDPLERAVRQERTPAALRGRVFAAMYAVPKVVVPLGVFSAGLLIEVIGLRGALLAFAIGNAVIAIVIALVPAGRALERTAAAHDEIPKEQASDLGGRSHRCRYRNR